MAFNAVAVGIRVALTFIVVVTALLAVVSRSFGQAVQPLIAFERNAVIYVMNSDGTDQRRLVTGCCFEWSPDGTKIAFYRPNSNSLWVIGADGTGLSRLASGGYLYAIELKLSWSPDGEQIAFIAPPRNIRRAESAIWVVNADGSGAAQLSSPKSQVTTDEAPAWSPDGTEIAFTRNSSLIVMKADGSSPRVLARGLDAESPVWSPDGATIAFEGPSAGIGADLYLIGRDGSRPRNITPTVSPNESDAALVARRPHDRVCEPPPSRSRRPRRED